MPARSNRDILIKIEADISNFKAQITTVSDAVKKFDRDIKQSTGSVRELERVTGAIKFQTMAQGLLNVSSATAQLITSSSNLEKVQYQVRASATAVERAEDQIARKRFQLAQVTAKYGEDSEKARIITNELATAQEQLANKQDRLKIAQDQVNDTYILFASNIANTMFGSLMTINSLLSTHRKEWLLAKLAVVDYNAAIKTTTGYMIPYTFGVTTATSATKAFDVSVKGLSFSIKGFQITLGPIMWAIIGISTVIEAYNGNWWGFKDAIDGVAKSLGLFKDEVDNASTGIDENEAGVQKLSEAYKVNFASSIAEATTAMSLWAIENDSNIDGLAKRKTALDAVLKSQEKLNQAIQDGIDLGTRGGTPPLVPSQPRAGRNGTAVSNLAAWAANLFTIPSAAAEESPRIGGNLTFAEGYRGGALLSKDFEIMAKELTSTLSGKIITKSDLEQAVINGTFDSYANDYVDIKISQGGKEGFDYLQWKKASKTLKVYNPTAYESSKGLTGNVIWNLEQQEKRLAKTNPYLIKKYLATEYGVVSDMRAMSLGAKLSTQRKNRLEQSAFLDTLKSTIGIPIRPSILDRTAIPREELIREIASRSKGQEDFNRKWAEYMNYDRSGLSHVQLDPIPELREIRQRMRELGMEGVYNVGGVSYASSGFIQSLLDLQRLAELGDPAALAKIRGTPLEFAGLKNISKGATENELLRYVIASAQSSNKADQDFIKRIGGVTLQSNGNVILSNKTMATLEKVSSSKMRTEMFLEFGVDVGAVADSLPRQDVVATASFEMRLRDLGLETTHESFASKGLLRTVNYPLGGLGQNVETGVRGARTRQAMLNYGVERLFGKVTPTPLGATAQVAKGLIRDPLGARTFSGNMTSASIDPSSLYAQLNAAQGGRMASAIMAATEYAQSIQRGGSMKGPSTPAHILDAARAADFFANSARGQNITWATSLISGNRFTLGFRGSNRSVLTQEDEAYLNLAGALGMSIPDGEALDMVSMARQYVSQFVTDIPSSAVSDIAFGLIRDVQRPIWNIRQGQPSDAPYIQARASEATRRINEFRLRVNEADDIARYNSKLEQISTGVTII